MESRGWLKSITLDLAEMRYAKLNGMTPPELVSRKFKHVHDLNFNPYEVKDGKRFLFEKLVDGSWYITYLETTEPLIIGSIEKKKIS